MIVNTSRWMDTKSQFKDNMGIFSSLIFALTLRVDGQMNPWTNLFMKFKINMEQGCQKSIPFNCPSTIEHSLGELGFVQPTSLNMEASRPTSRKRGCAFRRNMVTHSHPRYTPYFACALTTRRFGQMPVKETLMPWKERNGWKKTGRGGSPIKIGSTSELSKMIREKYSEYDNCNHQDD